MKKKLNKETALVEYPARLLLEQVGWVYLSHTEIIQGRGDERDGLFKGSLRTALLRLNEWMAPEQADRVIFNLEHLDEIGMARNQKVHEYLTYGMPLDVDGTGGRQTRIVRFFDFEHPEGGLNEFIVTTQFRVTGGETIIPDLVLFVNGIPLVVMEAKSPDLGLWRTEAVRQLHRYQEHGRQWRGRGAPELFHYNLLCVAHCGTEALFGGLYAPESAYFEWKSILPYTDEEAQEHFGVEPGGQARLIIGLLQPAVLLDVLRDFVVYEHQGGRLVKKLPRYQQYRTVRAALDRIRSGCTPQERGGVVWHTQGSGKSLTMLWLAVKLRREARLGEVDNPTILVITDRIQLDRQITSTFENCGFPSPERAGSAAELRRLLTTGVGRTVMTTVQKFEDALADGGGPEALNPSPNVVVMVDEAHRTQYGVLAARMSQALPQAALIGFTGTPIDKGFRHSTMGRFGPLIDSYTIPESVADGTTVPIRYELRKPDLAVADGRTLDRLFDAIFGGLSEADQANVRRKYANRETLAQADRRIEMVALDIAEHFKEKIRPNRFKAQVVAPSRKAALAYARYLRDFGIEETYPIITITPDDGNEFDEAREIDEAQIVNAFAAGAGGPEILVVVDKLLTGFDAPIEQALYLDRNLKEHSLLQAIARVNRPFAHQVDGVTTHKYDGLVVDYHGVSRNLEEALAGFDWKDVQGSMVRLEKGQDAGGLIEAAAAKAESHFRACGLDDLWACVAVFAPGRGTEGSFKIDLYQRFNQHYRQLAVLMDRFLPDPQALRFLDRLRRLTEIRSYVRAQYLQEDAGLDWTDLGAKAKKLIDDHVSAEVRSLMKPLSILDRDFDQKISAVAHDGARASLMEHTVGRVITRRWDENPVFYRRMSEQLQEIIEGLRQGTFDDLEACRRMEELGGQIRDEEDRAVLLGHTPRSFAVYELLRAERRGPDSGEVGEGQFDEEADALARRIDEAVAARTGLVDWKNNQDAVRLMRRDVKRALRTGGFEDQAQLDKIGGQIVEIAKRRT